MRSYVILSTWTDQGIKNSRDTIKRANHFRALIESRGGKLRELCTRSASTTSSRWPSSPTMRPRRPQC